MCPQVDEYIPIREAMPKQKVNNDLEEEYNFKAVYQKEMLCAGETYRVCVF